MSKISKKNNYLLNFTTIVLIVLSLFLSILGKYFFIIRKSTVINQIQSNSKSIDLFLSPDDLSLAVGNDQILELTLNTNSNPVLGSVIELEYDPSIVSISAITQGNFFPDSILDSKIQGSRISFGYGLPYSAVDGKIGEGTIVTFKVHAVKVGSTELNFTDNTEIIPSDKIQSDVATIINSTLITVVEKEKIPEVSPSLEPSSTKTPSPSLVPTPTPIPTPKPTKKPVMATPKPEPSVLVVPSPTPAARVYKPLTGTPFDQTVENYDARGVNVAVEDVKITPLPTFKPTIFTTIGNYFRKVIGI